MQIIECEKREGALLAALVDVWERSVRATHAFLSEEEILAIREFVPQALSGVERLVVALEGGVPLGFMGAQAGRLEMLFLAPEARGRGLGGAAAGGGDRALRCRGADGERAESRRRRLLRTPGLSHLQAHGAGRGRTALSAALYEALLRKLVIPIPKGHKKGTRV